MTLRTSDVTGEADEVEEEESELHAPQPVEEDELDGVYVVHDVVVHVVQVELVRVVVCSEIGTHSSVFVTRQELPDSVVALVLKLLNEQGIVVETHCHEL